MNYLERFSDIELTEKLNAGGAVLIKGPKGCGKTETAKRVAKSVLNVDHDFSVGEYMNTDPKHLLKGDVPRLFDEWQAETKLWNYIRHEIDDRKSVGQFILTGSANPEENAKMHSGAGRFLTMHMRPLSLAESKVSTKEVGLESLVEKNVDYRIEGKKNLSIEETASLILKGGWPILHHASIQNAQYVNQAYVDLLTEVDMSRVSNVKRDPKKVDAVLKSLSRNISTMTEIETILKDAKLQVETISKPTIYDYLKALENLMIVENVPAFSLHIRSSASLRKSPKLHFVDPSLAVAILGLDLDGLLDNIQFLGYLFESLVVRDLRIYANTFGGSVYHYHDSQNREVDAIVQKRNGDWAAFEIKLGRGRIDEAVDSLHNFRKNIDESKMKPPSSLNVIVSTGESYTREDGINIISIGTLTA